MLTELLKAVNRPTLFFLTVTFCFCITQSNGQNIPSWKVYYDSTQLVWDRDWDKAISLLTKAEQYALIDLGLYDENYLAILSDLGLANWRIKNYHNAEKFFKRTIALKREMASDSPEFYSLLNNLAGLYAEQEKWGEAKKLYKIILAREPASIEQPIYTTSLKNILVLYDQEGQPDSILYVLETDKIKHYISNNDDPSLAPELELFRARAFRKRRNYNEASIRLESLRHDLSGKEQSPLYTRMLQEIGMIDLETGLYSKAEKNFLQAYRQVKSTPSPDHVLLTTLLNNLAYVYDKLSIYDKALAYYQESLSICQLSYDANSLPCATLQSNIAGIYLKQDKAQEAIGIYLTLLERLREVAGESSVLYIAAVNNLSTAYRINHDYKNATLKLNEAYELVKKYKLEKEDIAATILNNLAVLHTASGSFSLAASYAEKAYSIKRSIYGEQSVLLLDLISNMAVVYWALNDIDKALPMLDKSIQLSLRQIKYVFPALNEREQVQFYKKLKDDFERFNTIACGLGVKHPTLITQMFNNQIMIKSLIFFTQQRRSAMIMEKKDSALNADYEDLRVKREQLGYFYQLPLNELKRLNISLTNLEKEVDQLEKTIMLKTSEDLTPSGLAGNVQWHDIQPLLKPEEALVEVIRFRKYELRRRAEPGQKNTSFGFTDSIYYAALITTAATKDQPTLVVMKDGNNLETRFLSYYKNALTFGVTDYNSYPYYWQPIENALDGRTQIFFSGDGVYHKLNLNTLRQAEGSPYLLQRYDIHQLSNPAQYLDRKKTYVNKTAVLIGDPVFDFDLNNTTRGYKAMAPFSALPGTYAEILAISEILNAKNWKTTVFLKGHATERNLKKVRSPGMLHIATHGFFSADVISLNEEAKNDFLFHSGLILSGANKYIHEEMQPMHDDGIVTAYEVMNLDLSNTDLVVLSACETGLGKIENGEGVYGLQRSFLQAGARSVLISLWKVDDAATKELMIEFYTYLSKGFSKREALKLAELDQMKRDKNPTEWGGFVLVGAD